MLDEKTKQELHERLLAERQRLEGEIAQLQSSGIRADTFQADEMTDIVDQHPADAADELFEREKNMTLVRTLEGSLQQVNEALAKYENGTYGICDECGKEIPLARLQAMPEATHCIDCQSKVSARSSR
ncbi:MAG TPA: TraR/DksA C4-type zinc finger protein [Chloroflexota bacterium]|nr:TraR/DksA C4-type zinc finger protein [Chloroflexota bacterium]